MTGATIVSVVLAALFGSAVASCAADGETFTGTAASSGTHKRPLFLVDGKRYELKASDEADASVAETLGKFSKGDTGQRQRRRRHHRRCHHPHQASHRGLFRDSAQVQVLRVQGGGKSLRLTLPEDLKVVRGILVVGPYAGADSRDLNKEVWYREFMHLHDFAFLGSHWPKSSHVENYKAMQNALKQLAADSKPPELEREGASPPHALSLAISSS